MSRQSNNPTARWTPELKKLKAISIRQPWAWLIVNGYKDIENRVWFAKLRGPVLIHAGQSKSDTTPEALAYIKRKYHVADLPDTFETGGIVGIAEITDCVEYHRSKWFQGPYGWVMANACRLPFKPCKGQLKFFTPDLGTRSCPPGHGMHSEDSVRHAIRTSPDQSTSGIIA